MNITLKKNDAKARNLIIAFSIIVFAAVSFLGRFKLNVDLPFDEHIFAKANAVINTLVAILLIAGLITIRKGQQTTHRNIMLAAMLLSVLFLVSYICHHLFSGEARFGDLNHDGVVSADEKLAAGSIRYVYYAILSTHIVLAGIILPFILFTAFRALIGVYPLHRKLAKITWPIWLYVAATGPIVYLMISPYY
jgi:putative membrane protein